MRIGKPIPLVSNRWRYGRSDHRSQTESGRKLPNRRDIDGNVWDGENPLGFQIPLFGHSELSRKHMRGGINFTLSHFVPKVRQDFKYHYFYFLARRFFSCEGFPWWFTKADFFERWKKAKFSEAALVRIWKEWHKEENPFLEFVRPASSNPFTRLVSVRKVGDGRTIRITSEKVFEPVKSLPDFKLLCHAITAARPSKGSIEEVSEMERRNRSIDYVRTVRSRTLTTIGQNFGLTKTAISKNLTKAKQKFSFFNMSARYTTYNGQIMRLSNLYSIKGIEYRFSPKSAPKREKTGDLPRSETRTKTIRPKFLRKASFTYWTKIEITPRMKATKSIFIPREMYCDVYSNVLRNL